MFVERKEESTIQGIATAPLARASEVQAYKAAVDAARAEAAQPLKRPGSDAQQKISQYREQYARKLAFDYTYTGKAARAPFLFPLSITTTNSPTSSPNAQEKPTIYEVKDGKPNLINFNLSNGVYVIPKIVDHGYLVVGKKKLSFERHERRLVRDS